MLNRSSAPNIKDAVEFEIHLPKPDVFTLKNGIAVYHIEAGAEEVAQIEWVFKAGNWFDQQKNSAFATNFLLKNGTTYKNAYAINEYVDFYGAYLSRNCFNETAVVSLHCLSKHLEHLLPLVQELFMESIFPVEELDIFRQNMKQKLTVNLKKCDFVAGRKIDELLFGENHPYGVCSESEDYDALTIEAIKEFYRQYYLNGHCTVFSAGVLPKQYAALMDRYFGDLPFNRNAIQSPVHSIHMHPQKKWNLVNDPAGVQGAIRIARPFPTRHHPDFPKVQVLNTLFGGFFGSRLMTNIREDKGYTYGIYSYLMHHIQAGAWIISTEAGRDVCAATIDEVYREMERLKTEPIENDELLLVKNYLIGTLLGDLDGPFHVIGRWKSLILSGLTEDYFYRSVDTIKKIDATALQTLAKQYLNADEFYELVVV